MRIAWILLLLGTLSRAQPAQPDYSLATDGLDYLYLSYNTLTKLSSSLLPSTLPYSLPTHNPTILSFT